MAIQAVNERSRLHLDVVQPCLEAAGISEGIEYSASAVENVLGVRLHLHLKGLTDVAIEQVDQSIVSGQSLIARFYDAMKKRYPKQTIIYIDPNQSYDPCAVADTSAQVSNAEVSDSASGSEHRI